MLSYPGILCCSGGITPGTLPDGLSTLSHTGGYGRAFLQIAILLEVELFSEALAAHRDQGGHDGFQVEKTIPSKILPRTHDKNGWLFCYPEDYPTQAFPLPSKRAFHRSPSCLNHQMIVLLNTLWKKADWFRSHIRIAVREKRL